MQSCAITDVGMNRQMNQDFVYASDEPVGKLPNLYIVADGMGGHNAGDFASRFCVEEFTELVKTSEEKTIISIIEACIRETNEGLIKKAAEYPEMDGMGTTFVLAVIDGRTTYIANIGDSRLYIVEKTIKQITEDHSLVNEMVRKGELKRDEARFHPKKNIVTRAISAIGIVTPDFFEIELEKDSIILLCSDGLSNMLGDDEIFDIINNFRDNINEAAIALINRANDNGGKDNISVVLIK